MCHLSHFLTIVFQESVYINGISKLIGTARNEGILNLSFQKQNFMKKALPLLFDKCFCENFHFRFHSIIFNG